MVSEKRLKDSTGVFKVICFLRLVINSSQKPENVARVQLSTYESEFKRIRIMYVSLNKLVSSVPISYYTTSYKLESHGFFIINLFIVILILMIEMHYLISYTYLKPVENFMCFWYHL